MTVTTFLSFLLSLLFGALLRLFSDLRNHSFLHLYILFYGIRGAVFLLHRQSLTLYPGMGEFRIRWSCWSFGDIWGDRYDCALYLVTNTFLLKPRHFTSLLIYESGECHCVLPLLIFPKIAKLLGHCFRLGRGIRIISPFNSSVPISRTNATCIALTTPINLNLFSIETNKSHWHLFHLWEELISDELQ